MKGVNCRTKINDLVIENIIIIKKLFILIADRKYFYTLHILIEYLKI